MNAELLPLLERFIAFRTTDDDPGSKHACLEWIEQTFFSPTALNVHRGDVDGAPYLFLGHQDPKLLWFAHVDVVPAEDDQFLLQIDGDRVLGRGVKDMKGATLAFLIAYREYVASHGAPPVSILLTSDEETGGDSTSTLFSRQLLTPNIPVAVTPDCGGVEPLVTEQKGVAWVRLTYRGTGTHGATPWNAANPVYPLADALRVLAHEFPAGTADDWRMTVTPTELGGSHAVNQVPDAAWCTLDIRFPKSLCTSPIEAIAFVERVLPNGYELEVTHTAHPVQADDTHPIVELFQRVIEEVEGYPVRPGREHGASDARYFDAAGVPAFVYGPKGGGLHSREEWVSVGSLQRQIEISRRILQNIHP